MVALQLLFGTDAATMYDYFKFRDYWQGKIPVIQFATGYSRSNLHLDCPIFAMLTVILQLLSRLKALRIALPVFILCLTVS